VLVETVEGEQAFEFDALLIATGRKPNVAGLGLEKAGIDYDERSGIEINDRMQTTNPDIYAVGDVASKYQFTHMSDFGARLVIRNALFFGRDKFFDLLVPWATYTDPEELSMGRNRSVTLRFLIPKRSKGIITAWSLDKPGGNETDIGTSPVIAPSPAHRWHS